MEYISGLIIELQRIQEIHGDLPVFCQKEADEYIPHPIVHDEEIIMGDKMPKRVVL